MLLHLFLYFFLGKFCPIYYKIGVINNRKKELRGKRQSKLKNINEQTKKKFLRIT